MDPNETLRRIRSLSSKVIRALDSLPDDHVNSEVEYLADQLASNTDALLTWLENGGFPPDWRR